MSCVLCIVLRLIVRCVCLSVVFCVLCLLDMFACDVLMCCAVLFSV